jgi:hypothetical protein
MKVTMLLADSAQAVGGKLYILGGGWSLIGPAPTPMALAIKIDLPWDRANIKHHWRLELLDVDERPVRVDTGIDGERQPLFLEGELEVGRPPGLKAGTALDIPLAINLGPLPLEPGRQYQWRFSFRELKDQDWRVQFATRPQPPATSPIQPD